MSRTESKGTKRAAGRPCEGDCDCSNDERHDHPGGSRDAPAFDAWVGRTLGGRYIVQQKIGSGASGAVYLGRDAVIGDKVAIKIVCLEDAPSSKAARSQLERVEREVQAAASLSHPHLVRFVDFIDLGTSHAGIVTDFVEGETLEAIMDRSGALETARALEIVTQIALGVGAMHGRHIVHRDLKPANIIVQDLPGQGDYCQVIDFGIVRYEDEASRTNAFLGTPLYASPEQVKGSEIDHRADVYSLGAILFEMLTGRPPFDEDKAFLALMAHARTAPPSLSDAAPGRAFEPWLEELVGDMLEKSPRERIPSMADVVRRIRARGPISELDTPDTSALYGEPERETLVYLEADANIVRSLRCPDGSARPVWDVGTSVTALALGPDSIIAGTRRGTVEQFTISTESSVTLFEAPRADSFTSVGVADDGSVVAGAASGRVYVNAKPGADTWRRLPGGAAVAAVAISSTSGAIVVSREDATSEVYVLDRSLARPTVTIAHDDPVDHIEFSADGFLIGAKGGAGRVRIYSIVNGVQVTEETACPYSASPDRAACPRLGDCPMMHECR